jgi:hypothetical protein
MRNSKSTFYWMVLRNPGNHDRQNPSNNLLDYETTVKSINITSKTYQYIDNGEPMRGGCEDNFFLVLIKYVVAILR